MTYTYLSLSNLAAKKAATILNPSRDLCYIFFWVLNTT